MEQETFHEAVLAEYEKLVRTARKRLRLDETEALDLAHEALARVYESLGRFDPSKGSLSAWMAGILRNLLLQYREGRLRPAILTPDASERADPNTRAVADALLDEIGSFVRACVGRLPSFYRDVVRMRYFEGLELREIARRLKVPLGTVKARLSRAPGLMRDVLQIQATTARFYLDQMRQRSRFPGS